MELKDFFNECAINEINKRTKEQELAKKRIDLRNQWCDIALEKLSFLKEYGFRISAYRDCEYPYVSVKAPRGWAFADILTEHILEEDDLSDNDFYVCSNTSICPCKSRITWENYIKAIAKWI